MSKIHRRTKFSVTSPPPRNKSLNDLLISKTNASGRHGKPGKPGVEELPGSFFGEERPGEEGVTGTEATEQPLDSNASNSKDHS